MVEGILVKKKAAATLDDSHESIVVSLVEKCKLSSSLELEQYSMVYAGKIVHASE